MDFGFGAWASGRWQNTRATHAPLTRHSHFFSATHAPLTCHSRATHICSQGGGIFVFHILHLPFCGYSHFPFWVLLWPQSQEKRPSATHPPPAPLAPLTPPSVPLTGCPRHSLAKRATHRPPTPRHGMVLRWSSDGLAEKGWQIRVGKEEEAQGEAQENVTISCVSSNVEKPFFDPCRGGGPLWVLPRGPEGASRRS